MNHQQVSEICFEETYTVPTDQTARSLFTRLPHGKHYAETLIDDMRRLLIGEVLSPASRKQLSDWLLANTTGGSRLRAGLPRDWRVGDKTGTGDNGASNDIAIVWPPGRAPLLVTAYYAESSAPQETRNAVLAEVGNIAAGLVTRT